jgi:hypothetical protein
MRELKTFLTIFPCGSWKQFSPYIPYIPLWELKSTNKFKNKKGINEERLLLCRPPRDGQAEVVGPRHLREAVVLDAPVE